jgi:hypothetical protein
VTVPIRTQQEIIQMLEEFSNRLTILAPTPTVLEVAKVLLLVQSQSTDSTDESGKRAAGIMKTLNFFRILETNEVEAIVVAVSLKTGEVPVILCGDDISILALTTLVDHAAASSFKENIKIWQRRIADEVAELQARSK